MNKKILIIDDNIEICEMYKAIFETEWFIVKIEYDWLKWLTAAIDFIPDLIILDIMMPQTDGYEVLESIKMHTSLETIIYVNSNLSGNQDEKKALDLWADKYLRKSAYTPSQVLEEIKHTFQKAKPYNKKKILIIDDNEEICEMYSIVLWAQGLKVKIEKDWLRWLSTAIDYKPDLIILDIMMPELNWFEVLDAINKHSELKIIVIVNSNLWSLADEKKALDLWAKKFLNKADYTPMQVVEIVTKYLEK